MRWERSWRQYGRLWIVDITHEQFPEKSSRIGNFPGNYPQNSLDTSREFACANDNQGMAHFLLS